VQHNGAIDRKERLGEAGLCAICAKEPAQKGRILCLTCSKKTSDNSRRCRKNVKVTVLTHYGNGKLQCCWLGCLD
jgi:hypothetical protein